MTISYWNNPKSSELGECDILIIGAGLAGLSTAYWLKELNPDLKIKVVDRGYSGAGASGRNAGFLTKGSAVFYQSLMEHWGKERAHEIYQFAKESISETYQRFLKNLPHEKTSSMTLFSTSIEYSELEKFQFTWMDSVKLPNELRDRFVGGFESAGEYKINPMILLTKMKDHLLQKGVEFVDGISVFEVTSSGVKFDSGEVKAEKIVLAINAYFPQFHKTFKDKIIPRRAQMLAVELTQSFNCNSLYYDPQERVYWRKEGGNILLIGGKRLLDVEGETGDFEKVTSQIQAGLEEYLSLKLKLKYNIIKRWSGTMGFTAHELPFIEKVESQSKTYMLGGFSGHGIGLGFLAGKEMAELVLEKKERSLFSKFKKEQFIL